MIAAKIIHQIITSIYYRLKKGQKTSKNNDIIYPCLKFKVKNMQNQTFFKIIIKTLFYFH